MSGQTNAGPDDNYYLSTRGVDSISFIKKDNPPLAFFDKGIMYELNDGILYFNGVPLTSGGGSGDVVGPISSTNNAIVRFDGTTGKLIQDSATILIDSEEYLNIKNYSSNMITIDNTGDQLFIGAYAGDNCTGVTSNNILIGNNVLGELDLGGTIQIGNTQQTLKIGRCVQASGNLNIPTAFGYDACKNMLTGSRIVALGNSAGYSNSGTHNVYCGYESGYNCISSSNTLIGDQAGYGITSGSNNTCLGGSAGTLLTTGSNNICIKNNGEAGDDSVTRIGSIYQNKCFIGGISGKTTGLAGVAVLCDSNGQLGTISSSEKVKENIRDIEDTSFLHYLGIKNFEYIGTNRKQAGFIAERVQELKPELIIEQGNGIITVDYQYLFMCGLKEIQKNRIDIAKLRSEIDVLKSKII